MVGFTQKDETLLYKVIRSQTPKEAGLAGYPSSLTSAAEECVFCVCRFLRHQLAQLRSFSRGNGFVQGWSVLEKSPLSSSDGCYVLSTEPRMRACARPPPPPLNPQGHESLEWGAALPLHPGWSRGISSCNIHAGCTTFVLFQVTGS